MPNRLKKIREKVRGTMLKMGHVEKGGWNDKQRFKYQAWDDVLVALRNACVETGLIIETNCDSVEYIPLEKGGRVLLKVRFTMSHPDCEDELVQTWPGEGNTFDDKAIQKAGTGAMKYFILKNFMVTVEGEEDPDGVDGRDREPPKATASAGLWHSKGSKVKSVRDRVKKIGKSYDKVKAHLSDKGAWDNEEAVLKFIENLERKASEEVEVG